MVRQHNIDFNLEPKLSITDYEVFSGMILIDLTQEHIFESEDNDYNPLIYHILKYSVTRGGLYISKIFPGSNLLEYNSVKSGMMIISVNGYSVKNVAEFRKIVLSLVKKGIKDIILLTDRNIVVNVNINESLENEEEYRVKYNYKKNKFYEKLEMIK